MLDHILKKCMCVISTVVEISQTSFLRCTVYAILQTLVVKTQVNLVLTRSIAKFDFAQHDICSLGSTAILT